MHIIPRHKGDFPDNDVIYDNITLKSFELRDALKNRRIVYDIESKSRKDREPHDMAAEAKDLRNILQNMPPTCRTETQQGGIQSISDNGE